MTMVMTMKQRIPIGDAFHKIHDACDDDDTDTCHGDGDEDEGED